MAYRGVIMTMIQCHPLQVKVIKMIFFPVVVNSEANNQEVVCLVHEQVYYFLPGVRQQFFTGGEVAVFPSHEKICLFNGVLLQDCNL